MMRSARHHRRRKPDRRNNLLSLLPVLTAVLLAVGVTVRSDDADAPHATDQPEEGRIVVLKNERGADRYVLSEVINRVDPDDPNWKDAGNFIEHVGRGRSRLAVAAQASDNVNYRFESNIVQLPKGFRYGLAFVVDDTPLEAIFTANSVSLMHVQGRTITKPLTTRRDLDRAFEAYVLVDQANGRVTIHCGWDGPDNERVLVWEGDPEELTPPAKDDRPVIGIVAYGRDVIIGGSVIRLYRGQMTLRVPVAAER